MVRKCFVLICWVSWSFNAICGNHFSECQELDVFIDANKDIYLVDDTIYSKIVVVNHVDKMLFKNKLDLSIELINEKGEILYEKWYLVSDGTLNLYIPPLKNCGTGLFNLVAYTKGCEKTDIFYTYQKPILILEPNESYNELINKKGFNYNRKITQGKGLKILVGDNHQNLIGSNMATVPIKAFLNKKPVELSGTILNNNNDSIGKFFTAPTGFGRTLTPISKNELYILKVDSTKFYPNKFPLYIYDNKPLDIMLEQGNGVVKITCFSNDSSRYNEKLILTIDDSEGNKKVSVIKLGKEEVTTTIRATDLPEGITEIKLLDLNGTPEVTKLFYNFWPELEIISNKDSLIYYPKDEVDISVEIKDNWNKPIHADLLVYVKNKSSFTFDNKFPYLSRLTNFSENYLPVFFPQNLMGKDGLNNVLSYYSNSISPQLAGSIERKTMGKESGDSLTFFGSVEGKNKGKIIAYCLDDKEWVQVLPIDKNGNFSIKLPNFYGKRKITLFGESFLFNKTNQMQGGVTIKINKKMRPSLPFQPFNISDSTLFAESLNKEIKSYLFTKYLEKPLKEGEEIKRNLIKRSSIYDMRFVLEEYEKMPSMFDVVREIVRGASVRKSKKEGYKFRVFCENIDENFPMEPVFFIDDNPVFDKNIILSLNLSEVESIDVINSYMKLSFYGPLGKNGIFRVNTKSGTYASKSNDLIFSFDLKGYDKFPINTSRYYSPKNEELNLYSTVLWDPNLKTDEMGQVRIKFNLNHEIGDYYLIIKSLSNKGIAGEKTIPLIVRSPLSK